MVVCSRLDDGVNFSKIQGNKMKAGVSIMLTAMTEAKIDKKQVARMEAWQGVT